jgi:hypothetical protein
MRWTDFFPLGSSRSLTPEGFLLCRDVGLARTGVQLYGPGETPIDGDFVSVTRDEDEVFHPDAIASCDGKPVVNNHPVSWDGERVDVNPSNWRTLAVGICRNPHKSEAEPDMLVGDLVIYDADAIRDISAGKTQISLGYDAEYEVTGPNAGRQHQIRINHIALVDQGRCGIRCSIGDSAYPRIVKRLVTGHRLHLHGHVKMADLYRAAALVGRR